MLMENLRAFLLRLKWCVLLDAVLDLSFYDFGGSKKADLNREGLLDLSFFDPRVDSLNVTAITEIFELGPSLKPILVRHFPHGSSILKTAEAHYVDKFDCLVRKGEFPDTSQPLGSDIVQDCWKYKVMSAEGAHQRSVKFDC